MELPSWINERCRGVLVTLVEREMVVCVSTLGLLTKVGKEGGARADAAAPYLAALFFPGSLASNMAAAAELWTTSHTHPERKQTNRLLDCVVLVEN